MGHSIQGPGSLGPLPIGGPCWLSPTGLAEFSGMPTTGRDPDRVIMTSSPATLSMASCVRFSLPVICHTSAGGPDHTASFCQCRRQLRAPNQPNSAIRCHMWQRVQEKATLVGPDEEAWLPVPTALSSFLGPVQPRPVHPQLSIPCCRDVASLGLGEWSSSLSPV